jgi:hypothetical protein
MELKEFVSRTLTQLIAGVKDAQAEAKTMDAHVNPHLMKNEVTGKEPRIIIPIGNIAQPIFLVDFDVAITASEGSSAKGGLGIFVSSVGIGGQGESKSTSSQESRIRFVVPISLPLG